MNLSLLLRISTRCSWLIKTEVKKNRSNPGFIYCRFKSDLDKNSILELREDIDDIRVQLQKANLEIEELIRENTGVKRGCDARNGEVQALKYQIKDLDNKNERSNDENRSLAISLKGLKEERKRLEDECDTLSSLLD